MAKAAARPDAFESFPEDRYTITNYDYTIRLKGWIGHVKDDSAEVGKLFATWRLDRSMLGIYSFT